MCQLSEPDSARLSFSFYWFMLSYRTSLLKKKIFTLEQNNNADFCNVVLHLFQFLVVRQVCDCVKGLLCTLRVGSGTGSDQSELLRVGNFRGLSTGLADGLLDVIFSFRRVDWSSKGYMSRSCWLVPARHAQVLIIIIIIIKA